MRVVLDTNVVVSAFLSPSGKPAALMELALSGGLTPCFNTAILTEYEQVLRRPKFAAKIGNAAIERFFEIFRGTGVYVAAVPSRISFTDESDRRFYDVARAAGAFVATGNKKHFPNEPIIKSPAQTSPL